MTEPRPSFEFSRPFQHWALAQAAAVYPSAMFVVPDVETDDLVVRHSVRGNLLYLQESELLQGNLEGVGPWSITITAKGLELFKMGKVNHYGLSRTYSPCPGLDHNFRG